MRLELRFDFQSSGQLLLLRIQKGTCDIKAGLAAMAQFAIEKVNLGLAHTYSHRIVRTPVSLIHVCWGWGCVGTLNKRTRS